MFLYGDLKEIIYGRQLRKTKLVYEGLHFGIEVGAHVIVNAVPGQEGAEDNVAGAKKMSNPRVKHWWKCLMMC